MRSALLRRRHVRIREALRRFVPPDVEPGDLAKFSRRQCPDHSRRRSRLHDNQANARSRRRCVTFSIVTLLVACCVAHTCTNTKGHARADAEGRSDKDRVAEAGSVEDTRTDADDPQAVSSPMRTTKEPAPTAAPTVSGAVQPGAFCSQHGAYGYTVDHVLMRCKTSATDSRYRWRKG
jgi:hypothetical protein